MAGVETDRIIASIAAGQYAAVGRRQLLHAGVPAHVVDHRVRGGLLIPMYAGVCRVPGSPVTSHQRIMGATLAAGAGAVASHPAAGFLLGLEGIEPKWEVTANPARAPHPRGVIVHRLTLGRSDIEVRDGIPRTRAPATILGLAAVVPGPLLEGALDNALRRGLVSCAQLQRRLDAGSRHGRNGAAALAELLTARAGAPRWTQSEFERRLFALIGGARLPLPTPQFEVVLPDGRRIYLDFAGPDTLVALEAQSYRHHAGRIAWSRDQVRMALLASMGWRIVPVTWEDLIGSPRELIETVKRARAA
jgi:very-short-patch-repair endonuclease